MGDLIESSQLGETPIGPVKILRRPKQQICGIEPGPNRARSAISNESASCKSGSADNDQTTHAKIMNERLSSGLASSSSIYDNDDEWPSIADASKCLGSHQKSQQQQQRVSVLKKPASPRKSGASEETTTSTKQTVTSTGVTKTRDNNASMSAAKLDNKGSKPSGPMKTYKERADDYAKARLRILGSASSE